MITLHWTEGDRTHTGEDLSRLPDLLARKEVFVWVDVEGNGPEAHRLLSEQLKFHQLAVDDAFHPVQRPKLEEYGEMLFLVVYEVCYRTDGALDEALAMDQLALFLTKNVVVSVHEKSSETIREIQRRCHAREGLFQRGPAYLLYLTLDAVVDRFFPVVDAVDEQIDALEDRVVQDARKEILDDIFALKRNLIRLRRVASPTRDVVNALLTHGFPEMPQAMVPYFRDVADHLTRIYEVIDTDRDLVSGALEAYLSTVSNRMNLVMQRLTIITVIFLPLTFVTGIFGMNFRVQPWMPPWDRGQVFWMVMAGMTVAGIVLAWWFHRKRLL